MFILALTLLAATPDVEALAKAAEEKAFAAIEKEEWCDAMNAFVEANALVPSAALVFNAAQAAEFADDKEAAAKLYKEMLSLGPDEEQRKTSVGKIKALREQIDAGEAGVSCPVVVVEAPKDEADKEAPPPPPDKEKPEVVPVVPSPSLAIAPIATIATGTVLTLAGIATSAVGIMPFLGHQTKVSEIQEAERKGSDASALQVEQIRFREDWESWGEVSFLAGLVVTSVGVVTAAGGGLWLALDE